MIPLLRVRVSDFGRRHPRLFFALIIALGVVTTILLLYQIEQPTVVYENF